MNLSSKTDYQSTGRNLENKTKFVTKQRANATKATKIKALINLKKRI